MLKRHILWINIKSSQICPRPFFLESERPYEDLINIYEKSMLNFVTIISSKHMRSGIFLVEMEEYSKQVNFDLNGLKLYLNVFLADGTIQNIVYFLSQIVKILYLNIWRHSLLHYSKNYKLKYPLTDRCSHQSNHLFSKFYKKINI